MLEIVNNPWVVGVVGGLLSGAIITWISRFFLSKRENKEYLQKVDSANRDIVYSIRVGIPEQAIPSVEVLNLLIRATARKHRVNVKDVYEPRNVAEDLVREVMDSSFIPATQKMQYCEVLAPLAREISSASSSLGKGGEKIFTDSYYRNRLTSLVSGLMGTVSALTTLVLAVLLPRQEIAQSKIGVLTPTIVGILTIVVAMAALEVYRASKRSNNEKKRKRMDDDGLGNRRNGAQD